MNVLDVFDCNWQMHVIVGSAVLSSKCFSPLKLTVRGLLLSALLPVTIKEELCALAAGFKCVLCILLSGPSPPWIPQLVSLHCLLSLLQFPQNCLWGALCWCDDFVVLDLFVRSSFQNGLSLTWDRAEARELWITSYISKRLVPPPSLPEATRDLLFSHCRPILR